MDRFNFEDYDTVEHESEVEEFPVDFADFDWAPEIEEKVMSEHRLQPYKVEECFYDVKHRRRRGRGGTYFHFGRSEEGRYIFVVFRWTLVGGKRFAKIITAYDMTDKQRDYYEKGRR